MFSMARGGDELDELPSSVRICDVINGNTECGRSTRECHCY